MKTEQKVAAITGGYKGIGGALSELLAQKGYALVGTLRNQLSGVGIRVTCFNPGGTKTSIFKKWQSERNISSFMDPVFVAQKIVEHIESDNGEWNPILRRH